MAITVRKLDVADAAMAKSFDCGESNLNDYLKRFAEKHQDRHLYGVTYVAISSEVPDCILGYCTLANTSICRDQMPEQILAGLPKYADIPAILIGRFAVDQKFSGRGVGHLLMSHALNTCVDVSRLSAVRYILTLAYEGAVSWYQKYGFQEIPTQQPDPTKHKMYLDLAIVRAAQEIGMRTLFSAKAAG